MQSNTNFKFCCRRSEISDLENLYSRDGFKFAVIYGRRRVGKSSLIQQFISEGNKPNISFMGIEQSDSENISEFSEITLNKYPTAKSFISKFENWSKLFDYIAEQAGNERLIVFIDEFPYLANANSSISSVLQKYIDNKFKNTNIMLILCGSSMSFMENQVLGHKSPLYGRRDMQLKVEPFDYYDTGIVCKKWNNLDKALAYGVTSGIPQYLNKLIFYDDINISICNEFLKRSGSLFEEPRNLLLQELREPALYNTIIKAIAKGSSKLNDISMKVSEENTKTAKYLKTLSTLHIVQKEYPITNKTERNGIYKLDDNMFKFWYSFVMENYTSISSGMANEVYEGIIKPELPQYMGHVFEDMCIQYLNRQNKNSTLPFMFTSIGRWWGNNPIEKCQEEIDIIAEHKKSAIFAECKWRGEIGVAVLEDLRRKSSLFNKYTQKYYYIFSKNGFTKQLQDIALTDISVILVTLDDIYNR